MSVKTTARFSVRTATGRCADSRASGSPSGEDSRSGRADMVRVKSEPGGISTLSEPAPANTVGGGTTRAGMAVSAIRGGGQYRLNEKRTTYSVSNGSPSNLAGENRARVSASMNQAAGAEPGPRQSWACPVAEI